MDVKSAEKQEMIETLDLQERLDKVLKLLANRLEVLKITRDTTEQTQSALGERQREAVLREQLRQLQKELGDTEDSDEDMQELEKAIEAAGMPTEVGEHARKELKRLQRMNEASPEHGMVRNYLDWLVALPWAKTDVEDIDIDKARRILDEDHYGLDKVKRRILEYLAVRKLNPEGRSPILCFVGPPGVGKTSLGQSIARALGLKFQRTSLGGVHDEAEIRGHRRTYIGALPGNIIQGLRKAGTRNPVFMLDEIDKLNASHQGDPSSALLEVLDPEQNGTFRDNYIAQPFDLSRVLFIATANVLETIPGPLRDRMEIIQLTGYTEEEKLQIARRYLVNRQLKANGLQESQVEVTESALKRVIHEYTRESGCRNLEREIGALLRHAAMRIAEGKVTSVKIDGVDVPEILGPTRFENDVAQMTLGSRCCDGTGLDAGRRRHPVRRVSSTSGLRQVDPDGSARRCHEGKRSSCAQSGEGAGGGLRYRSEGLREQRHSRARASRCHTEGRTECRRCDVHLADFLATWQGSQARCRDDR